MRLNNNWEFSSKVLMKWFKINRIIYEFIVIYAADQNDVAEWSKDLLLIRIWAMMHNSSLNLKL